MNGPLSRRVTADLDDLIAGVGRGMVATQGQLDDAHAGAVLRHATDAAAAGLDVDDPLVRAVAPARMVLAGQTADLHVTLQTRRSVEVGVGVALAGRTVHAFAHARRSSGRTMTHRLIIETIALPVPAAKTGAGSA